MVSASFRRARTSLCAIFVKTVSEIFMPASGEILAVNAELEAHPEFVNEDAFGKGWMVKIKLAGPLPADLLDAEAYKALVSEESH